MSISPESFKRMKESYEQTIFDDFEREIDNVISSLTENKNLMWVIVELQDIEERRLEYIHDIGVEYLISGWKEIYYKIIRRESTSDPGKEVIDIKFVFLDNDNYKDWHEYEDVNEWEKIILTENESKEKRKREKKIKRWWNNPNYF